MNKFAKLFKKQTPETTPTPPQHELCAKLLKGVDSSTQRKMYEWCNQYVGDYRDHWYGYSLDQQVYMMFTSKQDLERFCNQFGVDRGEQAVDRPA